MQTFEDSYIYFLFITNDCSTLHYVLLFLGDTQNQQKPPVKSNYCHSSETLV